MPGPDLGQAAEPLYHPLGSKKGVRRGARRANVTQRLVGSLRRLSRGINPESCRLFAGARIRDAVDRTRPDSGLTTAALPGRLTLQTFQYSATPATPLRKESRFVHQNFCGNPAKQKALFRS